MRNRFAVVLLVLLSAVSWAGSAIDVLRPTAVSGTASTNNAAIWDGNTGSYGSWDALGDYGYVATFAGTVYGFPGAAHSYTAQTLKIVSSCTLWNPDGNCILSYSVDGGVTFVTIRTSTSGWDPTEDGINVTNINPSNVQVRFFSKGSAGKRTGTGCEGAASNTIGPRLVYASASTPQQSQQLQAPIGGCTDTPPGEAEISAYEVWIEGSYSVYSPVLSHTAPGGLSRIIYPSNQFNSANGTLNSAAVGVSVFTLDGSNGFWFYEGAQ